MNQGSEGRLLELLNKEKDKAFTGWDFSYLEKTNRMQEFPLEWNYHNIVVEALKNKETLLDMGTGGGEFLACIEGLPKITHATEGYEPNIVVAKKRLEPLGIKVYPISDESSLPLDDKYYDVIINRHESYDSKEVLRILKDDGLFITQQVGGLNDKEINEWLGTYESPYVDWNVNTAMSEMENAGLYVMKRKSQMTYTRFYDIGAVVYYLKAIPWQVPGFTIEKYYDKLQLINQKIGEKGYVDLTQHRFLIIARKA